jgi:putative CocE/NonD family hydrolase
LAHPGDDAYWAARRPDVEAIDVPSFTVMGWFDDFSSGTAKLIDRLGAEAWCGPWAHMPWGTRHGGAELGAAASPSPVWDALVSFFDRMFGRDDAAEPSSRVRYFVVGDGWRASPSWPPPHSIRTMAGYSATGNANSRWGDGVLVATNSDIAPGKPTTLVAEPHVAHPGDPLDYQDDSAAHDLRDVACYTSVTFVEPLDIAGSPVVRARTISDRPRHDLVAMLAVVDPDGTARSVTGSARRLLDAAVPGAEVVWSIELRPIAVRLEPGQQLRLSLSAARFPCHDRNGHTAEHDVDTTAGDQVVATIELRSVELDLPVPNT